LQRTQSPKLDALTGLRYFAAMMIFVTHVLHAGLGDALRTARWHGIPFPNLVTIGMPLFFTLSGFLMVYNYGEKFRGNFRATLRSFYVARFARIYPLVLSLSAGRFFHELRDRPADTLTCLALDATLTQSWVHLPVFQGDIDPRTVCLAYLGVSWSVSVEAFFYLTFPFLCVPVLRYMTSTPRIIAAAAAVFGIYVGFDFAVGWNYRNGAGGYATFPHNSFPGWLTYYAPYARYGEFLVGCLTGALFLRNGPRASGSRETRLGRVILGSCLLLMAGISFIPVTLHDNWMWLCVRRNIGNAPFCAAIIYCLARYPTGLQTMLARPALVLLGEASYGIYLLHPFVQSLFAGRIHGEEEIHHTAVVLFNHAAMFAVLHMLCLGTYQFIETPARIRLRRWLDGKTGPHDGRLIRPHEDGPRRVAA
jgi:peptidoglycan/LPS O-acetylase OafA/YrhL